MNVKVYYQGLGWYSGRVKGDTLVYNYNPRKRKDPKHPNVYLLMKEGARGRVSKALNIELKLVTVL